MRRITILSVIALAALAACGDTLGERTATGALGGAAVGTLAGGPIIGTAAGATVGAGSAIADRN